MPNDDHVALLAEHDGLVVGVASYEVLSADRAEMAILVDDAWQGDGIGSLLIEDLTAVARRDGIQEPLATCSLPTSTCCEPAQAWLQELPASTVRILALFASRSPHSPTSEALAAAGARDRTAEHILRPVLAPASLAVIGVSRCRAALGTRFSAPSSPADSRAGHIRSIHTPRRLTDLRVTRRLVRFPLRWTWRSSPCRPRALPRSSRSAGSATRARPACSAPGSPRPAHPVRRRNRRFWPRPAGTTSG